MKPEYRVREVTRYVITRYDGSGTEAVAEVTNRRSAEEIRNALEQLSDVRHERLGDPIDTLGLPVRTRNILHENGVRTVSDLVGMTEIDLLKMHDVGRSILGQIKAAVEPLGGLYRR